MKYVIGWLTAKPGEREAVMARLEPFIALSRTEEGVHIFEVNRSSSEPDVVVFIECYESEAVHVRHQATPEHQALLGDLAQMALGGRFDHIYPERMQTNTFSF